MWATLEQWRVPAHPESREDGCSQNGLISWLFSWLWFSLCNSWCKNWTLPFLHLLATSSSARAANLSPDLSRPICPTVTTLNRHINDLKIKKSQCGNTFGKEMHYIYFFWTKQLWFKLASIVMFTLGEHSSSGADLCGFVLVRQAALALWLFRPLSLQVRPDDGIERHCPPHARAQLVRSGLPSCQTQTTFYWTCSNRLNYPVIYQVCISWW